MDNLTAMENELVHRALILQAGQLRSMVAEYREYASSKPGHAVLYSGMADDREIELAALLSAAGKLRMKVVV